MLRFLYSLPKITLELGKFNCKPDKCKYAIFLSVLRASHWGRGEEYCADHTRAMPEYKYDVPSEKQIWLFPNTLRTNSE